MFGLRMQELRNRNVKESNVFALERRFMNQLPWNREIKTHIYMFTAILNAFGHQAQ
jgi:hypothetical protein